MIRSLGFGLDRNAEPQPVDSEAVKLIKRGPEYDRLKRKCSGVTDQADAIDEALVTLKINGYIALPADYSRPNAEWNTPQDENPSLFLKNKPVHDAFFGMIIGRACVVLSSVFTFLVCVPKDENSSR